MTVQRYGRRTCRLSSALEQITLALGGSAGGCRLPRQLGILASGSTLLRQLKKKAVAAIAATRVVGIDEWAWPKGHRYGTILCDLEKAKVIDSADRAFNLRHVEQLFRAQNVVAHRSHKTAEGFDIDGARKRLGLTQE